MYYTCKGKGGKYEVVAQPKGAGTMRYHKDELIVYRDIDSGEFYVRTLEDFGDRMEMLLEDDATDKPKWPDSAPDDAEIYYDTMFYKVFHDKLMVKLPCNNYWMISTHQSTDDLISAIDGCKPTNGKSAIFKKECV